MERDEDAAPLAVEVVYCPRAGPADVSELLMPHGATARDALSASGLLDRYPQLQREPLAIGIWGRRCAATRVLRDGDRVEVYRPLLVDPKEARRLRYDAQRAQRRRQASSSQKGS